MKYSTSSGANLYMALAFNVVSMAKAMRIFFTFFIPVKFKV